MNLDLSPKNSNQRETTANIYKPIRFLLFFSGERKDGKEESWRFLYPSLCCSLIDMRKTGQLHRVTKGSCIYNKPAGCLAEVGITESSLDVCDKSQEIILCGSSLSGGRVFGRGDRGILWEREDRRYRGQRGI